MKHRVPLLATLVLTAPLAMADVQTIGVWSVVDPDDADVSMFTMNDSNSTIGKFCWGDGCYWLLVTDVQCEGSAVSPALLSIGDMTYEERLTCAGPVLFKGHTYYRVTLSDPDKIDRAIDAAQQAAIAFPIAGGTFKVVRFNTAGAHDALNAWRQRLAIPKAHKKGSTRDLTL
jgi:hypothetical protein